MAVCTALQDVQGMDLRYINIQADEAVGALGNLADNLNAKKVDGKGVIHHVRNSNRR
jgi:hypothetical protein